MSNSTNSRSALDPNVRLRLYWVTVGDTQGEERFITVIMLKKTKQPKTIGMCFLVDMADCVCNDDVQTYSIYIYKTCWYTSLSTFTRNNKSSHKETKTIYTYKRRRVEASHDVSDSTPVDPTVHNATSWRGCNSTSVLCTSVLTVRISSSSLECFHTCRNISLHWGNGSNSASVSIRSHHRWTFWSTVEGAGAVGVWWTWGGGVGGLSLL